MYTHTSVYYHLHNHLGDRVKIAQKTTNFFDHQRSHSEPVGQLLWLASAVLGGTPVHDLLQQPHT
jgi:hypothetical protein